MPPADLPVAEFAFPGPVRDRLVAAVLAGRKTTTSGLIAEYSLPSSPAARVLLQRRSASSACDARAVWSACGLPERMSFGRRHLPR